MIAGKPGPARSAISAATPGGVEVRGRDLASELMGHVSFTEYFHLLVTGRPPTDQQHRRVLAVLTYLGV